MSTSICAKCGEGKALEAFYKKKTSKSGRETGCIDCKKAYQRKYYKENRSKVLARAKVCGEEHKEERSTYNKKYREERKEELAAKQKIYYEENKEALNAVSRAYHAEHKEEISVKSKTYREKNKETLKAYRTKNREKIADRAKIYTASHLAEYSARAAKRRAFKLQATPSWANKDKILEVYKEARRLTETTGIQHHVDHIYPLQGETSCGLHVENNLQIVDKEENLNKSGKDPLDFYGEEKLAEILNS